MTDLAALPLTDQLLLISRDLDTLQRSISNGPVHGIAVGAIARTVHDLQGRRACTGIGFRGMLDHPAVADVALKSDIASVDGRAMPSTLSTLRAMQRRFVTVRMLSVPGYTFQQPSP